MIVEDHAVLRASLHDWLENIVPGASVLCAASVEEALETLAHAVADVVLMDIGLPGMNGIEGTRRVHERAPALPVVMLSILDDGAHVAEAMEAGAVAFVSKRRMRTELPAALQKVLGYNGAQRFDERADTACGDPSSASCGVHGVKRRNRGTA